MLKRKNIYKNISVLFIMGCTSFPSVAIDKFLPSQSCEITITNRDRSLSLPLHMTIAESLETGETNWSSIRLSRHHVIPASRLMAFFNSSINNGNSNNDNHELVELLSVISALANRTLDFYDPRDVPRITVPRTTGEIERGEIETVETLPLIDSNTRRLLNNINTISTPEHLKMAYNNNDNMREIINTLFVWMPFNLFEGPRNRTDDPGNEFEENARPILGDTLYNDLKDINEKIKIYLNNNSRDVFNEIISKLKDIISGRTYFDLTIYDSSKWEKINGKYRIKQDKPWWGKREIQERQHSDPYCFSASKIITDYGDKLLNVTIVEKVLRRAKDSGGFYSKQYNSWKDWYKETNWSNSNQPLNQGILQLGRNMVSGVGIFNYSFKPYGYKFKDGSFAVGIIGDDVKYGDDNWKSVAGSDWGTGDKYAGQVFFDRDGRPVAIVITDGLKGGLGAGWSFIYKNGKWEYQSTDDWHTRLFSGSTLSLDSHAPRFFIDTKNNIETVKYGHDEL